MPRRPSPFARTPGFRAYRETLRFTMKRMDQYGITCLRKWRWIAEEEDWSLKWREQLRLMVEENHPRLSETDDYFQERSQKVVDWRNHLLANPSRYRRPDEQRARAPPPHVQADFEEVVRQVEDPDEDPQIKGAAPFGFFSHLPPFPDTGAAAEPR